MWSGGGEIPMEIILHVWAAVYVARLAYLSVQLIAAVLKNMKK